MTIRGMMQEGNSFFIKNVIELSW